VLDATAAPSDGLVRAEVLQLESRHVDHALFFRRWSVFTIILVADRGMEDVHAREGARIREETVCDFRARRRERRDYLDHVVVGMLISVIVIININIIIVIVIVGGFHRVVW